jgi:hypothetical protein
MSTETTATPAAWFHRLLNAIGFLFGALMVASLVLLFRAEEQAAHTASYLEEGAEALVPASAERVDPDNEGKLVHVSGPAGTTETLEDKAFGVSANALRLQRVVQMYQWHEHRHTQTRKAGKTQISETKYTYTKAWDENPINSSRFRTKPNPPNPGPLPFRSQSWQAGQVRLGAFELTPALVARLPTTERVPVGADHLARLPEALRNQYKVHDGTFYKGQNPAQPQVGDVRIEFRVLQPTPVSIVAKQVRNSFAPFQTPAEDRIELVVLGTKSADAMFKHEETRVSPTPWGVRLFCLVVAMIGVYLMVNPFVGSLERLPVLRSLLGAGLPLFAILIGLALALLTVAAGWVSFRPELGFGLIGAAAAGVLVLYGVGRGRRAVGDAPPQVEYPASPDGYPVEPSGIPIDAGTQLGVGSRVQAFEQGRWWRAEVVALENDGRVRIHFPGWDSHWDRSVARSELQRDTAETRE